MRKQYPSGWLFFLILLFVPVSKGFSEGSKQIYIGSAQTYLYLCSNFTSKCNTGNGDRSQFAVYDCNETERLYFVTRTIQEAVYMGFQGAGAGNNNHIVFRVKNAAGTIVYAQRDVPSTGFGYIANITQARTGPNQLYTTGGYNALSFHPASPGLYYIEFQRVVNSTGNPNPGTFNLELLDITVADTVAMVARPGRLYSKAWQFAEEANCSATTYIYSNDSIITSLAYNALNGGTWIQFCNQWGCYNTGNFSADRKSVPGTQALLPQYKIFVNTPDPLIFPPATTLGQVIPPLPWGEKFCNDGHIIFHVTVDKPGTVQITLNFPPPYIDKVLSTNVVAGENMIPWDGFDNNTPPVAVPNNVAITFTVSYINGLTNLPLYDVEGNPNGFSISLISPPGTPPPVYWDDTSIANGTINLTGCLSPPSCHTWSSTIPNGGFGNLNTMNTWWFNVSSNTNPVTIYEYRNAQLLTFLQQPPQSFCENSSGHMFSVVPDPNTDVYHWSYAPSTGVTVTPFGTGTSATVSFGPGATSGVLSVYGTNANCMAAGPIANLAITLIPAPLPVISGPTTACAGSSGNVYATQAGKTNYQWMASSGGIITAGGGLNNNTATVTWNSAGAHWVSVVYTDNGCTAASPVVYPVTVSPLPVPALSGNIAPCLGSTGNTYTTATGKLNYIWTVSSGGTITGGGTTSSNNVVITWNSPGPQTVSVRFTEPSTGCTAANPTVYNVNVQTLSIPTINGPNSVCAGQTGSTYNTEAGGSNYIWTVSSGGSVTAGGTTSDNTVTVTWNTTGSQTITVIYTNSATGCLVAAPATFNILVKPLPVPSLAGPVSACINTAGPTYTTEAGMGAYQWAVVPSSAGVITSGATTNAVNVVWTSLGTHEIRVNYASNITGCTAAVPASLSVVVNPLPVITISGSNSPCTGIPVTYVTEGGFSNYLWNISLGGTIISGGQPADASITVIWNTAGPQSVNVNYTIATGCTAAVPTVYNIDVHEPTVPVITSPVNPICATHATTYTVQPGMTGYSWTVSPGGTITSGGSSADNTATVQWNSPGNEYIEVNFTNGFGCTANLPSRYDVTVHPLPVPALTGPTSVCVNNPGPVYATDPAMNSYTWSILPPSAGIITGGSGTNAVDVNWVQTGSHTIQVNYINSTTGCTANLPVSLQVTVNILPVPSITGAGAICTGIPTTYTTQSGVSNYAWIVSSGGTIISGGTAVDPTVTVNWITPGSQQVSVNYTIGTGCAALAPTVFPVTVNQSTPPVIAGNGTICETNTATYSTQPGMSGYTWTLSPGGTFSTPTSSNTVGVLWNSAGPRYIEVNFTNGFGCTAPVATRFNVTVNALPVTTITEEPGPACQATPHIYQTPADPASSFSWSVIPATAGTISSGQGTNAVSVNWINYGNASLAVTGTNNSTGCFSSSSYPVEVYPAPTPSFAACFDLVTTPNAKKFKLRGGIPNLTVQGVYTGNRVSFNQSTGYYEFDPFGANPGTYPITFTFTNNYGCITSTPAITISVVNAAFSCGGILTDVRDGKNYKTSLIGGKCWMKENLAYGTILEPASQPQTDNCISEKYCLPSDPACSSYGGLYQWDELMAYASTSADQGLCPPEWHIPTETEWQSMINAISIAIPPPADGISGSFMKDTFLNPGFLALTQGIYYLNNTWSFSSGSISGAMYWTATRNGGNRGIARGVNSINPSTSRYPGSRENAFSVRCVKD